MRFSWNIILIKSNFVIMMIPNNIQRNIFIIITIAIIITISIHIIAIIITIIILVGSANTL